MQQILVYGDSLSWGIVPGTRERHAWDVRWPGVLEAELSRAGHAVRIIENCVNGRRTVWEDPFKDGRNGLIGLAQQIESHSPLALVIIALGVNDFQSMHPHNAWHSAQGVARLVDAVRHAPIEPGMPVPPILIVAPPPFNRPRDTMAEKFHDAGSKSQGLAAAYAVTAEQLGCGFFDAGRVCSASEVDGVHLDADAHIALGNALVHVAAVKQAVTG